LNIVHVCNAHCNALFVSPGQAASRLFAAFQSLFYVGMARLSRALAAPPGGAASQLVFWAGSARLVVLAERISALNHAGEREPDEVLEAGGKWREK
jgi:hypothetical protein